MRNEFTKKLFYVLALFTVSFTAVAQDGEGDVMEEAPEVVIDMDFNKSLYTNNFGNMYMSESPKAVLIAMVIPQSYDELKAELDKSSDAKVKNVKKGEATESGLKFCYFTGTTKEGDDEIFVESLMKKVDANSCIIITSMYQLSVKTKYEKEAKKALVSAKIVE